jgi:adenylylsulfate kinase-like enzyme
MVVWLVGLAGSGKTTIGSAFYEAWKLQNPATVFLDGDVFREIMGNDLGHSVEDREKNGWRICKMCRHLDSQSINVVACVLSNYPEQREWNRQYYKQYLEVFIDVSIEKLVERDQKGLYSGALAGNIQGVVGVDIPFLKPEDPDITIRNENDISQIDNYVSSILTKVTLNHD